MFKGKLIFPYEAMDDIDWVLKTSEKLPCIESFMKNRMGKTTVTEEQYLNMSRIYDYFGCKTMSDLLHIYTLEDGMLLAVIMSNTFQEMYESLGLDPTNFTSTAKFSYIACKRLSNLKMQTIPNGRVFNCIVEMKRAGFSMVKKQVSLASPLNSHIKDCQYSPSCNQCSPYVKVISSKQELESIKTEIRDVTTECDKKLKQIQDDLKAEIAETGADNNEDLVNVANQLKELYASLKNRETQMNEANLESLRDFNEYLLVLQSCLIYYDEVNFYSSYYF